MKHTLNILLAMLFPFFSYAQWFKSNLDSTISLQAASFLSKDTFLVINNGQLELTIDGGKTFNLLPNYKAGESNYLVYKSTDTIFAIGSKKISVSYDAGNTWFNQNLIMPSGDTAFKKKNILFFGFFDQSNGIVFGDSLNGSVQVFLTHNGGVSWEFYSHPSINDVIFSDIDLFNLYSTPNNNCILPNGTAKLLIGFKPRLLTITEYGRFWQIDTVSTRKITRVAFKDELHGLAGINVASGLAKTKDGGNSWIEISDSMQSSNGNLLYVKPTAKHNGFYLASTPKASGESNVSYDDGNTWQLFDTLNHGSGTIFFRDAETGICSELGFPTKSPVYYYKPSTVGLKEIIESSKSALHGYPNPTSDKIHFSMVYQSLELYDTQGRLIGVFVKTDHIDVSGFQNGLYWVKAIDSESIQCTQKLLIQH